MAIQEVSSLPQLQEAVKGSALALVHFWAAWCAPCQQMDSVLAALAQQHPGVTCLKVEAEAVDDVTLHYNISSVPTVVLIKGGSEVSRVEGADPPALTAAVSQALSSQPQRQAQSTGQLTASQPAPANGTNHQPHVPDRGVEGRIKFLLASHPVCLFMKGSVEAPRCGFSRRVVQALQELQAPIHGVDILEDEELRQGLKAWANWPTYPQLYVKGEFVGGCDIVEEMKASGELQALLNEKVGLAGSAPAPAAVAPAPASAPQPPASTPTSTSTAEDLTAQLQSLVNQQPVMVFMKGSPAQPRCGFSRKVVEALESLQVPFGSFDILEDEAVRQGLKEFSNWPTYPQVYVKGELLGGCDIVLQMKEGGELKGAIESMMA